MNDRIDGGVACNAPIVVMTEDGSHSLLAPALNEQYHSTHGAVQESRHVFIEAAFRACAKRNVRVLEIGFGTGLNAWLTLLETDYEPAGFDYAQPTGYVLAERSRSLLVKHNRSHVHYTALELYPVEPNQACALNYPERLNPASRREFERLHCAAWDTDTPITPRFTLRKVQADVTQYAFDREQYDVIYFDAFSPEKQPEMWSAELFERLYRAAAPQALLTTYCAKGAVRRAMMQVGFTVERLAGAAGKREMLRGRKGF